MSSPNISSMNKEYLASFDQIKEYFQKNGFVSLQEFLESVSDVSNVQTRYQPADYKYDVGAVKFDQLTVDFLEHISGKKISEVNAYSFSHTCFDLRKYFDKEGVFFVINTSDDELKDVGGEVYVFKDEEPLALPSSINTITLIKVSPDDESFVTYVNHLIDMESVDFIIGFME